MGGSTIMESTSVTIVAVLVVMVTIMLTSFMPTDAHQFSLAHKYAHLEGSPGNSQGRRASPEHTALLMEHDRRRLAALFALGGPADMIGLYYTAITLGTPPQQYHVLVDTGSDVMWVNCVPCVPNCPTSTEIPGITLRLYDPALSSSDVLLGCTDANCSVASKRQPAQCTVSPPGACGYSVLYGDMSSTKGYLIKDVLTFQDSPNTTTSSNVYFGCGTNQIGNLLLPAIALDGIIGFGQAAVSVPTQLADQGKVGRMFAHCLQGDIVGGGNLVIGNITEPNITYIPMVPQQPHYNVYLHNIAVNGVNITDPASFTTTNDGVIMDSGTSMSYLVQPVYNQFIAAIKKGAPVLSQQIPYRNASGYATCWIYGGDVATTFPSVTLLFDGASMNLAPENYLYLAALSNGGSAWCMAWFESLPGYTIFGDVVLKDQLVVYDNYNHLIGWKPFNCTLPIPVV